VLRVAFVGPVLQATLYPEQEDAHLHPLDHQKRFELLEELVEGETLEVQTASLVVVWFV